MKGEQEMENLKFATELKFEYIVSFHGHFVEDRYLYIIMDFCEVSHHVAHKIILRNFEILIPKPISSARQGRKLADFIEQKDKKTITEFAFSWCKQLMLVLMYLDESNIVHNDHKPA